MYLPAPCFFKDTNDLYNKSMYVYIQEYEAILGSLRFTMTNLKKGKFIIFFEFENPQF